MDYSTLSIESAIAKVIDDVYPNAVSFISGSFCCADGWYYLQARTESGKATTGTVQKWKGNDVYTFYRLAGADAVLKKLGSPEKVYSKATHYTGTNGEYYAFGSYTVPISGDYLIDYGSIGYGYSGRLSIGTANYDVASYSDIHTLSTGTKITGYIHCGGGEDETGFLFIHIL